MSQAAQLVLRNDPSKVSTLNPSTPTTIGRADGNRLRLVSLEGVADHHAVVRFSRSQGWLVCDWQSADGTFLEGERIRQCRRLSDGDEIQLGSRGPILVFRLVMPTNAPAHPATSGPDPAAAPTPDRHATAGQAVPPASTAPVGRVAQARSGGATARQASSGDQRAASRGSAAGPGSGRTLHIAGREIPLNAILSAHVRSRPRYPHSFSWWVLICLGSLVLLPFAWLFWGLQLAALTAWILLGSRKQHELLVTLRDGMAYRHSFASRLTAMTHRDGIRKAIGQSVDSG